jgi:GTP-binding protein HflX
VIIGYPEAEAIMLKFSSKPVAEHAEVPLADEGRLENLVAQWTLRQESPAVDSTQGSTCYVVSVGSGRDPIQRAAQMAEIVALVRSQGGRVVGQEISHLSEPNPRTLLRKGAAQDLAARARARGATMLVIDAELSPSQTRNLEEVAGIPICDREAIILNVFLRNARTRRARIQVEIAQLHYLRPRIRGVGLDMDQQAGGMAPGRGPGETASELLARKLDGRVEELEKALRKIEISGRTQRRQRQACKRLVLVGYTNAGKTSLMNALTSADLSARDAPFETLDTTSRCLSRHGGQVLLSDTVGFIRRLPERLLASFESTLAEIVEASLLVVVVDASDPERDLHLKATLQVVEKIGARDVPRFYVFNKRDRLLRLPGERELARWSDGHPWTFLAAADARAVDVLRDALLRAVRSHDEELTAFVPYAASDVLALVYGRCRVLRSVAVGEGLTLKIQGPAPVVAQIRSRLEGRAS